jgi:large repetitive protein
MKKLFLLCCLFFSFAIKSQTICDVTVQLACEDAAGLAVMQNSPFTLSTDCGDITGEASVVFAFNSNSLSNIQYLAVNPNSNGQPMQLAIKSADASCSSNWICLDYANLYGYVDFAMLTLTPNTDYLIAAVSEQPSVELIYSVYSTYEVCDGIDNDCDGQTDEEGGLVNYYEDADGDSFGGFIGSNYCTQPAGFVTSYSDCNDADATVNINGTELCNGLDDNCNGLLDDGLSGLTTFYEDGDNDGYGSYHTVIACVQPALTSLNNLDCNNYDPTINPSSIETCNIIDDNCNGNVDEGFPQVAGYYDYDQDGYGNDYASQSLGCLNSLFVTNNGDCNDYDPSASPGDAEICDGFDNNCDGVVDEGFSGTTYYQDFDGDGFGGPWYSQVSCDGPPAQGWYMISWVTDNTDCSDYYATVNPSASEVCDMQDNDCDGVIDEGFATIQGYYDFDIDGFGTSAYGQVVSCQTGYIVLNDDDCDDSNAGANPNGIEACDNVDNNCSGQIDEGFNAIVYYPDYDADGYGSPSYAISSCDGAPTYWYYSYVLNGTDCSDYQLDVNPSATEVCDGYDNNCDGDIDEGFEQITAYYDYDGDGYGNNYSQVTSCQTTGLVTNNDDCNDYSAASNPAAIEVCDNIDNNCNNQIDEGFPSNTFYEDYDGDGFGDPLFSMVSCSTDSSFLAWGYYEFVTNDGDCNDYDPNTNPAAVELCDGQDNNCNGTSDEDFNQISGYSDYDGDGFGNNDSGLITGCEGGYIVTNNDDCNDYYPNINPNGVEVCDGFDNNCNGSIDEGFNATYFYDDYDNDGFGDPFYEYVSCDGVIPGGGFWWAVVTNSDDCNDYNPNVNPDEAEACDGLDNNCNDIIDEGFSQILGYYDFDGDGFGNNQFGQVSGCDGGYIVTNDDDCNDYYAVVNPDGTEVCDGMDNDCNGTIDEGFSSTLYYDDYDNDGYGDPNYPTLVCEGDSVIIGWGYWATVSNDDDCNDFDGAVNPDETEVCDGVDNNCDNAVDEGFNPTIYYYDYDEDGFGNPNYTYSDCAGNGPLYPNLILVAGDCNDYSAVTNPDQMEVCNDFEDNDCDGIYDNAPGAIAYYYDFDQDGFGNETSGTYYTCDSNQFENGFMVLVAGDCNDQNSLVNPGAVEDLSNEIDDDCDNNVDVDMMLMQALFVDIDGDGFGSSAIPAVMGRLVEHPNHVTNNLDCHDGHGEIHPLGGEICNGHDDDCNGNIDDNVVCEDLVTWTAYPNPTTGSVLITLPDGVSSVDCYLYDAAGRTVFVQVLTPGNPVLDLSRYNSGTFTARIIFEGEPVVLRLIKI